jgi:hypothetical protein
MSPAPAQSLPPHRSGQAAGKWPSRFQWEFLRQHLAHHAAAAGAERGAQAHFILTRHGAAEQEVAALTQATS